jgi:hypothetical protein
MKIRQSINPLHNISQRAAAEPKRADLPEQITPEVAEAQRPDISALVRQAPLLADLQGYLSAVDRPTPPSRRELIEFSVERIVDKHLSAGVLTEQGKADMRRSISDFIENDPQLSRKFESILQRLSELNGIENPK